MFLLVCSNLLKEQTNLNKLEAFLIRLASLISIVLLLAYALWTEYRHLF